ncbi:hypothetical protein VT84_02090 [Gemmata sp. SH-PL17]|nr:hypothetical protein VT84_02090 [Gemmata sp. SH-PL17]
MMSPWHNARVASTLLNIWNYHNLLVIEIMNSVIGVQKLNVWLIEKINGCWLIFFKCR